MGACDLADFSIESPAYMGISALPTGKLCTESRACPEGVENRYRLHPVTVKAALAWVKDTHRHLPNVRGGLFASSVRRGDRPVAMGLAINPPRVWQGTGRIVIGRVAAIPELEPVGDHAAPACTMIYGSLCRAAKALGYREAWSYTLPGESGASLRAAGFIYMGETRGEEWDRPSRPRQNAVSTAKKGRWMRPLSAPTRAFGGEG